MLVETVISHIPFETVSIPNRFIVQGRSAALQYLSYLYFGRIENNLQSFTMRDLGLVKSPDFKDEYSGPFL